MTEQPHSDSHGARQNGGVSGITAETAHELNNLLTVVLGSLEQLHRQPLDGRGKAQLERAQQGVAKAGKVVQQVLGAFAWNFDAEPDSGTDRPI